MLWCPARGSDRETSQVWFTIGLVLLLLGWSGLLLAMCSFFLFVACGDVILIRAIGWFTFVACGNPTLPTQRGSVSRQRLGVPPEARCPARGNCVPQPASWLVLLATASATAERCSQLRIDRQQLRWPRLRAVRGHAQLQRLLRRPDPGPAPAAPAAAGAQTGPRGCCNRAPGLRMTDSVAGRSVDTPPLVPGRRNHGRI